MNKLLADFKKTAEACRQMAMLEGPEAEAELREDDCIAVYQHDLDAIGVLLRHLKDVTLHQLEAILDRDPDAKIAEKRDEIVELLNDAPRARKGRGGDPFREPRQCVVYYRILFPEIGKRLEYIAASLTARSSGSNVTHQTMITDSQIGGVAVGDNARARGTSTSKNSRQRR